jgi:ribosomal protein S18 acetylase RimI-like enzyme
MMHLTIVRIRPYGEADREWARRFLSREWGDATVVSRGKVHDPTRLPGFVAEKDGLRIGLATYHVNGEACELVTFNSLAPGAGIGSALLSTVKAAAHSAGCRRLWLITTNDNTLALRFYQKRGFKLAALHRNAVADSRLLKPQIPLTGLDGIPISDEIELEVLLPVGETQNL